MSEQLELSFGSYFPYPVEEIKLETGQNVLISLGRPIGLSVRLEPGQTLGLQCDKPMRLEILAHPLS